MARSVAAIIDWTYAKLPSLSGAIALLTRLFVGGFFMSTGWGKMHHLEDFAKNFAGWNIPYPHFNAALSAYTEFYGGLLTVLGIATRVVAIPMIINMLVAIFAVVIPQNVSTLSDFLNADEPLYILAYLWLMISGGGWLSADSILKPAMRRWLDGAS
jgi:putative oxidoreductase